MSQRRKAHSINMFWYRRIDDKVFYLADKPFPGTAAPTTCRPMASDVALEWLVHEVLWVPGHVEHRFSHNWEYQPAPDNSNGDLMSLAGLNDQEVAQLMRTFTAEAATRYGVRIDCFDIPRQHRTALVELLVTLLRDARGQADG